MVWVFASDHRRYKGTPSRNDKLKFLFLLHLKLVYKPNNIVLIQKHLEKKSWSAVEHFEKEVEQNKPK